MSQHRLSEQPVETATYKDWASKLWGVRTFLMGLGLDVAIGVTLYLVTVIGNLEWTRTYWVVLGLGVARSAIMSAVAYLARRLLPPKQS